MSTKRMVWLMVLGIAICSTAATARAQDATTSGAVSDKTGKVLTAFRLDFAMSESEDGKKINTRHYSMNLVPGYAPSNEIKIGTRVPVESKQGEMQYIDVGTNIWSRMTPQGDSFQLEVRADLSNIAPSAEQENRPSPGPLIANAPLVRQVRINASTVATPGKPTVIGAVEDPNSKRQFQLEVTVTQLK